MLVSSLRADRPSALLTVQEVAVGPEELPPALTERIAFLLQLALVRAQAMGEQALTELGLSGREYGLLALLERPAPTAQHRLGATLGLDRTTTMSLLSGLEERGLVRRERRPDDRRAYAVQLTPQGEQVRRRAEAVLRDCEQRFLEPLPAALHGQLREALLRLV